MEKSIVLLIFPLEFHQCDDVVEQPKVLFHLLFQIAQMHKILLFNLFYLLYNEFYLDSQCYVFNMEERQKHLPYRKFVLKVEEHI